MKERSASSEPREIAGYPAEIIDFVHREFRVRLFQVARLEELVDREALLREDAPPEPPYWAHLWIGARALARFLIESGDLAGRRVLDLGCGLGLPGLVAAQLGAEVWLADREPAALEFAAASARQNGLEHAHVIEIDFTRAALDGSFDVILGAEVVYDPSSYSPLCEFLERHLHADGVIHLTDAFRSDAERFFTELCRRGFRGERRPRSEFEDGRPQGLFLWTFRRSG